MLEKLNDQQKALLNEISYIDIPEDYFKEGMSIADFVSKQNSNLADRLNEAGIGHLVVKDYVNNNDDSGFCAIAFEDPDTFEVGMSFRGTEGIDDGFSEFLQNPKDMLDNGATALTGESAQSKEAIEFYEKNKDKDGGNYLYGHSKGGELASQVYVSDHENIKGVTIINPQPINPLHLTPEQIAALQANKFDAIVINGDIVSAAGLGAYQVRVVQNNGEKDGFFDPHSISAMDFDDEGNAIFEKNPFSGYMVQGIVANGIRRIIGGAQTGLVLPVIAVKVVIGVGTFLVDDLPEMVGRFVEYCQQQVNEIVELAEEARVAVMNFIADVASAVSNWFQKTFNPGFKYATAHPFIKVDTYKLQNYANRLKKVNTRLNSLEDRINSLYSKVGFLDLLDLMRADYFSNESWFIKRCISYLEDTANDFETAEGNILKNL